MNEDYKKLHYSFLEEELKCQVDDFQKKLETPAKHLLLDKGEVYVALFVKVSNAGELILKFPKTRALPRKGDFLYTFTVPDSLRSYKSWESITYGNLLKVKTQGSECHCVWMSECEDDRFILVGLRGVSLDFVKYIQPIPNAVTVLGPNVPPYEYLTNLQRIVNYEGYEPLNKILNTTKYTGNNAIIPLRKEDYLNKIKASFISHDLVVLQGPPGTGKTQLIAEICSVLCTQDNSILVTSLTNKALMEVAHKSPLSEKLASGKICKTNLTSDEQHALPHLQCAQDFFATKGRLLLSTFYKTSGDAIPFKQMFDYVIVDEGSQAFLATIGMARLLGKHTLVIGDSKQLPPITLLTETKISRMNYCQFIDGFKAITTISNGPIFQLSDTFRLGRNAATQTSLFYEEPLRSASSIDVHGIEGPIGIPLSMEIGASHPKNALNKILEIVTSERLDAQVKEIYILTHLRKSVREIQLRILEKFGYTDKIKVETAARVQGVTTDVVIYFIPNNESTYYSLQAPTFNVATSRAQLRTYIIVPEEVLGNSYLEIPVQRYLENILL